MRITKRMLASYGLILSLSVTVAANSNFASAASLSGTSSQIVDSQVPKQELKERYKHISEVEDAPNEVPAPYKSTLAGKELDDYKEKQKVKEDSRIIKELIEQNPESYSGQYYNPEKGIIVVQITKDSKELKDTLSSKIKYKEKIEYQVVKYSKKDFDNSKKKIKEKASPGSVRALIPDIINNKLIVLLEEGTSKQELLAMVDSPELITLDYGSIKTESDVDWSNWGTTIPMGALVTGPINPDNNTAPACTIGYFARTETNLDVAVTSGHCVPVGSNQDWFQPWNWGPAERIGSFSFRTTSSAIDGSDGVSDAGYIVLDNGHVGTGRVVFPSTPDVTPVVGFYTNDLVNDTIYLRGAITGDTTAGTIRYSNVDIWWGTPGYAYKENEVLAVGYTSTRGDSGGTILHDYAWDNNRQSWTFDLAGNHTGEVTIADSEIVEDGTYKVYEPIWQTFNDLNLSAVLLTN